jgi:hypothetical protein
MKPMAKFAFISRHLPTAGQMELAQAQGIELVQVGDADAFSVDPAWVYERGAFEGVVVVHPAAALRLSGSFIVGVYENANRAPEGEKPQFEATALHIFDLRD